MNFLTKPGYVSLGKIFELCPSVQDERNANAWEELWTTERIFCANLAKALANLDGQLLIVKDGLLELWVSPDILRYLQASRLRRGIFQPLDYQVADFRAYWGASMLIDCDIYQAAVCQLKPAPKKTGGRPEHPAKQYYADQNFQRNGRTLNEIQREMEEALGSRPPLRIHDQKLGAGSYQKVIKLTTLKSLDSASLDRPCLDCMTCLEISASY